MHERAFLIHLIKFQSERRLFTKFHRQLFCWIDKWHGLTMADIRRIEDEVQAELTKVKIKFDFLTKNVRKNVAFSLG